MLGVVLGQHLRGGGLAAQGDELVALGLDAAQDLAGQAPPDGVGLDQDEGASDAGHGAPSGRAAAAASRRLSRRLHDAAQQALDPLEGPLRIRLIEKEYLDSRFLNVYEHLIGASYADVVIDN